jgi:NAD-dependent dihydropyrimidine dehydrogenase PreA subunit
MPVRKIIEIDEERCDGCGACIPSCAEGALEIIDGKAKVVRDMYCDGLGACLGACPQDALRIIEREAEEFDEEAAMEYVRQKQQAQEPQKPLGCGCPGSAAAQGRSRRRRVVALGPEPLAGEAEAGAARGSLHPGARPGAGR